MSEFPLNIDPKEDLPEKLDQVKNLDPKYWTSAAEANKMVRALEELNGVKASKEQLTAAANGFTLFANEGAANTYFTNNPPAEDVLFKYTDAAASKAEFYRRASDNTTQVLKEAGLTAEDKASDLQESNKYVDSVFLDEFQEIVGEETVTGNTNSSGTSSTLDLRIHWTYPDCVIPSKSVLSQIRVNAAVTGTIDVVVGTASHLSGGFKIRKIIATGQTITGGQITTIAIANEVVYASEVVALMGKNGLAAIYVISGGTFPNKKWVRQREDTFVDTATGAMSFELTFTPDKKAKIYGTFETIEESNRKIAEQKTEAEATFLKSDEFESALEAEIERVPPTLSKNFGPTAGGSSNDTASSSSILKCNYPLSIADVDGFVTTFTINIHTAGTLNLAIAKWDEATQRITFRKFLPSFNVTTGVNTLTINEAIYENEILGVGGLGGATARLFFIADTPLST